jgi:hypothetical protein
MYDMGGNLTEEVYSHLDTISSSWIRDLRKVIYTDGYGTINLLIRSQRN